MKISSHFKDLLNDPSLIKTSSLINGEWQSSDSTFEVVDPFDNKTLVTVADIAPDGDTSKVEQAIAAAKQAQVSWNQKTAYERYELMMKWHDLMMEHKEDLAIIMTLEQGKPIKESRAEIDYGASYVK